MSLFKRMGIQFFAGEEIFEPEQTPENTEVGEEQNEQYFEGFEEEPDNSEQTEDAQEQEIQTQEDTHEEGNFVTINYNNQNINLPVDALVALDNAFGGNIAQILERGLTPQTPPQAPQGQEEIAILDAYAQSAGYPDRQSYMHAMKNQLNDFKLHHEMLQLKQQYPTAPDDALNAMAQSNINMRDMQLKQNQQYAREQIQNIQKDAMQKQEQAKNAELVRPFQEFLSQYPNVDIKSLDKNFFELVNTGLHPSAVYERLQAQAQMSAMKKNQQNASASIGSMQSSNINSDSFLSGFGI